ncbi:MAG: PQQ-dependent sugar dehydrogenase [Deltaproteobacteria bacterium]|nr:PQQ-dependent sugar dehydrogenase [Deltaproteobacteria bacterium]
MLAASFRARRVGRTACAMVLAAAVAAGAKPAAAQVCGDADRSGAVTVTDGVRALQVAAGLDGRCEPALCDLDGNGAVSVSDGVNALRLAAGLPAFTACPIAPALRLTPVVTGLDGPLLALGAPGDPGRLYVVEKPGRVRIVENGSLLDRPFLDVTALTSTGGEQGLLGLAFHPGYAANGRFFIYYTDVRGDVVVAEYARRGSDLSAAEPSARRVLRTIEHRFASNHNGGMIAFGADGYLYAGLGDGGGGGDPEGNAQNLGSKLGKMLRLDVESDAPPPGNLAGADPDVWDYGLRNPFRFSFDRLTGDLYIGDVGQGDFEEVDVEPRGRGGRNYGWDVTEGLACFEPRDACDTSGITFPALAYPHASGAETEDCSVIGGYVYRGAAIPALAGRYLHGDLCTGRVRSFVWNGRAAVSQVELTDALASSATVQALASFGEDLDGELYLVDLAGAVYRIDPR